MSNRLRRTEKLRTTPLPPLAEGGAGAPTFFLRTKLLPPRPTPALLHRPRLTDRLRSNLEQPVTLVAAPAGSGKTTLVADFVRTEGRKFVWYQLDRSDADASVFLGYVAHGIRQLVPGFGDATLSYLQQAPAELVEQPERAADVLLNEILDLVDQQIVFILDDYHHLGAETPVHRVVDRLLAYLPDVVHVIIISRDVPPLSLSRLRAHNALTIVDREELLFTDAETQELFRQVFDLELTPEQLHEYRERTHGWITALQLVRQVAQRRALARGDAAGDTDLVEILRQSERDIFDYFAEEVFADEEAETQQLLSRVSLLERIETDACAVLYPQANCTTLLPALVRRNVFMTVASDGRGEEYRLHPLFKDFLRRRLRSEIEQAGVAAEHARIADYFASRRQWEQAIHHLVEAGEFERAASLIAERGAEWLANGAFASLVRFVESLPEEAIAAHPRSLLHRAEVARLRGRFEAAENHLRRAAKLLNAVGDAEGEAEALHSLATIARRRGDCASAFTHLDRAVSLAGERSPVRVKVGNTRGLCYVALGEWATAEGEFRDALQLAEELNDTHYAHLIAHNLGLPAMVRGDFSEAMRWLRRMLRDGGGQAGAGARPVPQEAGAYLNLARCYLYRGEFEECERHLDRAVELCHLFNLISQRAEAFQTYGDLYRERGDAARAEEFYKHAEQSYEEAGIDLTRYELLEEKALLRLRQGDFAAARALLDRLIEARRAANDERGVHTASLARARVLLAQGETAAARAELEPALAYFRAHSLHYYEAQASLALAACEAEGGHDGAVVSNLRRALDLAARYDYEYWLRREVAADPRPFSSADARALLPPDLSERVAGALAAAPNTPHTAAQARAAFEASAAQVVAPKPSADLTIRMLGPVEIFRDPARPLAADAWTTKRARDILCFIASRRHRRASKDTIIDTFWGEADFDAVEKNFHPTVSHIRKALNSNQPVKQNFLVYRDGDYLLSQDFSYFTDTEEFDRLVAEGEAARRAGEHERFVAAFERAVELYRGAFMQGSYDDWVEEQRSYYSEQHLRMLETLAVAAQKSEDWARSLKLAQAILAEDQFREDVHCMIMRAHAAQGNRGAVKDQFENLRRLLKKELGVEPSAETQKVYKRLMG